MKTFKTRLFVLLAVLIPMLTANCNDKKVDAKADMDKTAEATAEAESVINLSSPPFKKFVVVTASDMGLFKKPDTKSPNLVRWIESDCESDFCESIYQWSDQPAKPGFEISTDIIDSEGRIFPVLGEEGDFYKVCTITQWCDIESAYIPKANVGDIEWAPITADMLESDENYFKCRVLKDGKYKDVVIISEYDELNGETLQVGVLKDGIVAIPVVYSIEGILANDQKEDVILDVSEDSRCIRYNKSLAMHVEEDFEAYQLDINKLSAAQIEKIIDALAKTKPEYVSCMYHFPAQGLQSFYYIVK